MWGNPSVVARGKRWAPSDLPHRQGRERKTQFWLNWAKTRVLHSPGKERQRLHHTACLAGRVISISLFIMTIYMSYLYERNDSRYYNKKHYERKVTQLGLRAIKWLQAQLIHKEFWPEDCSETTLNNSLTKILAPAVTFSNFFFFFYFIYKEYSI